MKYFSIAFLMFLVGCKASESVIIDAPVEKVWEYASNSNNAKDWSIYFDHISPLPGIPDGQVGSFRRCFRNANEHGMFWDEEVLEIRPLEYRQIRTYNIHGYKEEKLNTVEYKVEQLYEKISDTQTKMTFQASVTKGMDLTAVYYMIRDFREGSRVLRVNLENIKSQVEGKGRPHPYEPKSYWDESTEKLF